MAFFDPRNHTKSHKNAKVYAYAEFAYTLVDFAAAILFIIGSILFFDDATVTLGTWLFLVGSICFALRPSIKVVREVIYLRHGNYEALSDPE